MSQKVTLAQIVAVNEMFSRYYNVHFYAPMGRHYTKQKKEGFEDFYTAEHYAFLQNNNILRAKIVAWKDSLIYLVKYGYLHGSAKEHAMFAYKTINDHLCEISKVYIDRAKILQHFSVIAYAVRLTMPLKDSIRFTQYEELADLLTNYFTLYNEK